jgi:small multidrug resistance pump
MGWLLLAGAIAAEVTGTMALRALSAGWRITLALVVAAAYGASFVLLALALRSIAVSTAYAVWAGVGTAGVAVLARLVYDERITWAGGVGIALIVTGVVVLNLSGTAHG